jgi:serine/threonine protein kinase
MEQLIDQVLCDRYQITSLLSHQTGRRTLLAQDLQKNCPVVIKLLLFGPDFTWEDLKLFEREATVLQSLDHPAIPQYLDYFEVDTVQGKGFALVQTYIEATSLQGWVQSGRTFSEVDLKAIAQSLLNILDYLHNRQPPVIHRDIKPSNVLLSDRSGNRPGQVYLVDFGSVQTAAHGGTRTIVGTYGYMPPEQFGGQITSSTDLYALGATLIYLATGQHPDQLPQRELRILFEPRSGLSQDVVDWLKWLTEPNINLRLASANQALAALENSSLRDSTSTIVPKPAGSKVQVTNTQHLLEIVIPPNFHSFIFVFIGFLALWCFGVVRWIVAVLSGLLTFWNQAGLFGAVWLICFSSLGFWLLWTQHKTIPSILFTIFGSVRLRINQSEISLSHEMFGLVKLPILTSPQYRIHKIEITPLIKKGSEESDVYPEIRIWAGMQAFALGNGDRRLSDRELEWLAQNLSAWLKLPITRP